MKLDYKFLIAYARFLYGIFYFILCKRGFSNNSVFLLVYFWFIFLVVATNRRSVILNMDPNLSYGVR